MNKKEALDARIAELEATERHIQAVIDDVHTVPAKVAAAERYMFTLLKELSKKISERAALGD